MGHIAAQLPAADAEWDPLRGRIRILGQAATLSQATIPIRMLSVDARDDDGALRKSFKGNDAIRFADGIWPMATRHKSHTMTMPRTGRGSVLETLTGDSAHFLMLMEPGSRLCPGAIPHILHVVVKVGRRRVYPRCRVRLTSLKLGKQGRRRLVVHIDRIRERRCDSSWVRRATTGRLHWWLSNCGPVPRVADVGM